METPFYQLMLITHKNNLPLSPYLDFIATCAANGITAVQLREKNSSYEENLAFGIKLKKTLLPYKIPLIINDHLDLALELDAEGIHLGQSDGDPKLAREQLGPKKIIGLSIDTPEDLIIANNLPIDYLGVGAIFPTQNKNNVKTLWQLQGLKHLTELTSHPIVAVGGINKTNAIDVINAGAQGLAAIDVFHQSENPSMTTAHLRKLTNRIYHHA